MMLPDKGASMILPDVKKEFGAAVRAHRLRLGISQEALAERAELHRTYVTDVERGARNLSLESISRLARALDVSIDLLFSAFPAAHGSVLPNNKSMADPEAIDVVLVEDDPKDIELTVKAFAQAKFSNRIEVVRDGAAALDYLLRRGSSARRRSDARRQVVLLDLFLPKLNGLEVLREIRKNEVTQSIPVVVLTNSRSNTHLKQALGLGATAYILKPVGFENFSAITPRLNFYWSLINRNPQAKV
jgi:CheY-like chemotaxis protein/DNA-binding XRE family transcriptional regulator